MDNIYELFNRDLYRIDSAKIESNDARKSIDPGNIGSGPSIDQENVYVGAMVAGKQDFTNNESGYILGIDKGIPKFYIGDSTNYLNWTGTSLDISGNLTASTISIGTNGWHVDINGNMWWGSSTTYAGATNRISSSGVAELLTADVDTLTVNTIFRTNSSGPNILISGTTTSLFINDANDDTILSAVGETFSNGILNISPSTNDTEALFINVSNIAATSSSAYILNDGLGKGLELRNTRATNSSAVLSIDHDGTGYSIDVLGGAVHLSDILDIDSSSSSSSINIDETSTSGSSASISVTTARPAKGLFLDLNHTTNTARAIDIRYAGSGAATEGIIHIVAEKSGNSATCIALEQQSNGKSHINFSGDPSNSSPSDGDFWFDGTDLKIRVGSTTYTLNKTAV